MEDKRDNRKLAEEVSNASQISVPQLRHERQGLLGAIRRYVSENKLTAPLSIRELKKHSDIIIETAGCDDVYRDYAAVLLNNEAWRPVVAAIGYDKRLLLLPKCLRNFSKCPAQFDEIGLLCEQCGGCIIGELKGQAEELGYAVLVAEGSPVVMSLIETGQVQAIVGVSCLSTLEKTFPYMEAAAVAGIAIPLITDGCADTTVDVDWVWEAIYEISDGGASVLDIDSLRRKVDEIFAGDPLKELLGWDDSETSNLALEWLSGEGKRWRPLLAVSAWKAVAGDKSEVLPVDVCRMAAAVECFHKASLIHDDIEDGDEERYGKETLHTKAGVPIALNVGDFLLGEGYRLLTELGAADDRKAVMLGTAAKGHSTLCLGQGAELSWTAKPGGIDVETVIDIFRKKTSPAFAVALQLGAAFAGGDSKLGDILGSFSDALGIAYQIRDDIEDFYSPDEKCDIFAKRPSILLAFAYEQADANQRFVIDSIISGKETSEASVSKLMTVMKRLKVAVGAESLMESYKADAVGCLAKIDNTPLKSLLRRVVCKIFNDIEYMGCCNDNTEQDDLGS
ncbi:MAG: polyprenyl synthetase family protein [Anaerohalosphaera sp.]|nr:polyprenyl synthetase family protein [Anaerohalosphaera sp.]